MSVQILFKKMNFNIKDNDWFISLLLITTFLITPILYAMWKKEKNIASEYKKAYIDLREISENISNDKASIDELRNYFKEKERIEKLMNELADKASESTQVY